MRPALALCCWLTLTVGTVPALAGECTGNANALGTSRTITIDPAEHQLLGTMQYRESLPLADHEVVLTFDDGPLPPYTNRILDILASECVKATYFLVGRMAQSFQGMVRRIYNEGHTVGTHSQSHPLTFNKMPLARAQDEIEGGIASVSAALGDPKAIAPFFRIPGLLRAEPVEAYLGSRSLVTWSADFPADDWFRRITAKDIVKRALRRLEARGKGILLLHDIHPATVLALPTLLRELKARGYRIVHVVPSGPERPKTVTEPQEWALRGVTQGWPRIVTAATAGKAHLAAPNLQSFGVDRLFGAKAAHSLASRWDLPPNDGPPGQVPALSWPQGARAIDPEIMPSALSLQNFGWQQTTRTAAADSFPISAPPWPLRSTLSTAKPRTSAVVLRRRAPAKPVRARLETSTVL
ncbi:MAG: peptidoglycan-N-acetylglucosamine deacetylase [Alphaproteobacteria bacterium]|jgi:peptidoglycan/xylan/chitin deacetylase (PgdA/CDA1 family)|nr:peptidoglycan-N-acetylglucosamine deacetylase [Alphaproteobacteria bacterium]